MNFILASGSPRRKMLLEEMGISPTIIKPDVDESTRAGESPEAYVQRLAQAKAHAVADRLDTSGVTFVLAADTTVIFDDEIIGKPADEDEARRMLLRLRGQMHRVCTGFTLLRVEDNTLDQIDEVVCTDVYMRDYAASEMERWIASGQALDKAGGYAIQSATFKPVVNIDGSYNNVVGLPTEAVERALRSMGFADDFGG